MVCLYEYIKNGKIAYFKESYNYHRMQNQGLTLSTSHEQEFDEIVRLQDFALSNFDISETVIKKCTKDVKGREFDLDSKNFKLSIIIPVYNTEKYLKRCLDSAINAVTPITDQVEILIINDGSTDESEK